MVNKLIANNQHIFPSKNDKSNLHRDFLSLLGLLSQIPKLTNSCDYVENKKFSHTISKNKN